MFTITKIIKSFWETDGKISSSKLQEKSNKTNNYYSNNRKIITENLNEINLDINDKNSKINISCSFEKNHFTTTFSNSFTLDEIKKQSRYFQFCKSVKEVLNEIKGNKSKQKIYIKGNENISDFIILVIPIPSPTIKTIELELNKEKKDKVANSKEKDYVIKTHECEDLIENLKSTILINKISEEKTLKYWISPNKKLKAKLLYQFHSISYLNENDEEAIGNGGDNQKPDLFHTKCDNKNKILVICRSNNEIFGGYTPLCFNTSNKNENDNDSFLFSLNDFRNYYKSNFKNTESIKCNKNLGPCFSKDLFFVENKMNIVKFNKNNYLTKDNWVNLENCKKSSNGIILDDLEIFQIHEENYNFAQLKTDINNTINNNIYYNINNIDDINNDINNINNIINEIDNNSVNINDYNNNSQINIDNISNNSNNIIINTNNNININSDEIIFKKEKNNLIINPFKKTTKNISNNLKKEVKVQEKKEEYKEKENDKEYSKVILSESKISNNLELFNEEEKKLKENRGKNELKAKLNISRSENDNENNSNYSNDIYSGINNSENCNMYNIDNEKF